LKSSLSILVTEKKSCDLEKENLRATLFSKSEQINSLITQLKESENSQKFLATEKDNLEKRLEKAKEYFNTKRVEDETKLTEFENLKQIKINFEKKIILLGEEAAGLKEEIARLVSDISRFGFLSVGVSISWLTSFSLTLSLSLSLTFSLSVCLSLSFTSLQS
jgi:chromosome segregation ATPase